MKNYIDEIKIQEQIMKNTDDFISEYLDPEKEWTPKFIGKNQEGLIVYRTYEIYDDVVAEHIKIMNYKDFLETPYWKTISQYAKCNADFECELCGNNEELHLHHKTYTRHGYEHLPEVIDKDLIVLCNKCHAKLHNKN